ncbi:MAG: transglutaminase domain-containing protein [Holophagales bacterium]|nr:transglutaminase domain-containing protein [Holophagales bacterium]
MNRSVCLSLGFLVALSGCAPAARETPVAEATPRPAATTTPPSPAANVVTAEIQAGIEKHVEAEVARGDGYFSLPFEKKTLRLKLVRVHTEYLSSLGPTRQFACVDLADVSGDVYDVDFFLDGGAGDMKVSETTVHKLNGQPYYAWEQKEDKTWHRVEVTGAADEHLGVLKGTDAFEFVYKATLPQIPAQARMWLPMPTSDAYQTVEVVSVRAPGQSRTLKDRAHGNEVLFLELGPGDSGKTVEMRFSVKRREKSAYADGRPRPGEFLEPERLVPTSENFSKIAAETLAGKKGELVRARALYDHVIDRMRYMKYGEGWGQGDAVRACSAASGNCTDFHSYFIALARAAGIPARFAIGASIPSERNEGGIDGYHCWAEFWAEGKWWPVDISEADKYTALSTYYFGHHPANRIELSRGRDLVVDPAPASGPINFLAYPVLEVAGQPKKAKVEFSFERAHPRPSGARSS